MPRPSVTIHGHFYQPPREDPAGDRVPLQPSAAPYHDWNARVHDECYRAVVAARVLDGSGRIRRLVNTLEWISWDAGPTLLRWMARAAPDTYRSFLAADAAALSRTGHGNALACPYHHVILPLATERDRRTEIRWGVADFRRRFGRDPVGLWLPEAAVDTPTLRTLAQEGLRFTVVGPGQVDAPPADGRAGRVRPGDAPDLAVFVYDGPLSHDVAFGTLVRDARAWVDRVVAAAADGGHVSLAADGETWGHHHTWGDMALAATVLELAHHDRVRLESYEAALARHGVGDDLAIVERSSWSCAHGVERWRAECGCRMDPSIPSSQAWRSVLRLALDELAADLHGHYQEEAGALFADPWAVRDRYGEVLDTAEQERRRFVREMAGGRLTEERERRALRLLEMERCALGMFTSCGWFFDDLAGLEPLQVLRYAARALDLLGPEAAALEDRLRDRLASAVSNDPQAGDGRRLWDERVRRAPGEPDGGGGGLAANEPAGPAARRVVTAVRRLVRDPGTRALADVRRGLEDLEAAGEPPPFTAVTAVAEGLRGGGAPPPLREAARLLGFSDDATDGSLGVGGAVRFVFGVHVHQPVGNFDHVFRQHADDVYLPFLRRAAERRCLPLTLHVSGPLLEWLEAHAHPFLDLVGELAAAGDVELLLSGFYEPVLPALPRADRLEQIEWMRSWLHSRFGVDARGLWLTERVWEPGLAGDLADAGVTHVLLDDRHFLVNGHERHELHRPWRTGDGGRGLTVLPIDERLRYLIPFHAPGEFAAYLRNLAAAGHPLAVLGDDGEKFGGWPGTAEWVWQRGWMDRFLDEMEGLRRRDELTLVTAAEAVAAVEAAGLTYLPTASYREMEGWSLPPRAAARMARLEELARDEDAETRALVRGGHWRNFTARYAESGRMHRKALRLSALCRAAGDPAVARRALGRAQCNDAYWHGVFGGLYLRHLREAVWANLAEAEAVLRRGQPLRIERAPAPGAHAGDELWIHGARVSAVLTPESGGALRELTLLDERRNIADVLTRRREAYHREQVASEATRESEATHESETARESEADHESEAAHEEAGGSGGADAMPSIHDLEDSLTFDELPPVDAGERALVVERILAAAADDEEEPGGGAHVIHSWADAPFTVVRSGVGADGVATVHLEHAPPFRLEKEVRVDGGGAVEIRYRWDPADFPPDAWFAPEVSLSGDARVEAAPAAERTWRCDIRTVSKSEAGAEATVQGRSVTPAWPCAAGEGVLRIDPRAPAPPR